MEFIPEEGVILPRLRDHGKTALIQGEKEITYAELIDAVNSYASLLDVLPGDRVVILCENRPEWVYAFYSIWQRGAVAVPLDYLSNPEDIGYILKETEPSAVFCSDETEERLKRAIEGSGVRPLIYNVDRTIPPKPNRSYLHRSLKDLALILYTSGTTGSPKGVMLSFKNLLSNVDAITELRIVGKEDKTLALLPFHHAYPLMTTLLIPLHIGATVVFVDQLSSQALIQTMQRHRITVLVGVPRLYQLLHQRIEERIRSSFIAYGLYRVLSKLPKPLRKIAFRRVHKSLGGKLRFMVSGGAKLPVETALFLESLGFTVLEGYGLTETSPIVSFNPPNRVKLGSVGLPIRDVHVRIDKDGEVLVRGPNVMLGYYKKPQQTREVFKDGWFMTGDLGYLDEEGYLYIQGRKKEIIVLAGGKNVNPEELESMIMQTDSVVKECAVLEVDGSLKALIYPDEEVVRSKGIVNLEEYVKWNVLDKVNLELPTWKRITGFKLVKEELPKTRLGKLKRFMLMQVYSRAQEERPKEIKTLDTPTALMLREYLSKALGREVYGYEHLELDLGLDSLEKVELLSFIEKSFGIRLGEEELAGLMTLDMLSEYIDKNKEKEETAYTDWASILREGEPPQLKEWNLPLIVGRLVLKLLFRLYNRLEVVGTENIPEGPCIIAPNHASYLDGFVIVSALPQRHAVKTYFLGEEAYFKGTLREAFARMAHVITVNLNRQLRESLQKTAWLLRFGKKVVIFPEGARTRDGSLLPFKKGFAILSKELSVPVVPVLLSGTYESMSIRDRFPKRRKIRVIFLEPVYPEGKSYEEIVEETKKRIEGAKGLP